MSKIITLGEIMLRLSPEGCKRFVQVDSFDVIWGGGEANVVAAFIVSFGIGAVSKVAIKPSWAKKYSVQMTDEIGTVYKDITHVLETGIGCRHNLRSH